MDIVMLNYSPPNTYQIQQISEEYKYITEESVLQDYFELCLQKKNNTQNLERLELCLDHVRVILWKKKIPENYTRFLIEPFDDAFFKSKFILNINTFAKLRLAYDYSMRPWDRQLVNERYKTLAIMMDPKMNVIKHYFEFLYLKFFQLQIFHHLKLLHRIGHS